MDCVLHRYSVDDSEQVLTEVIELASNISSSISC